ncbi:hypothetical protein [Vagococcus salmoninarum]|uniref:hypothetical protein n=1 Tax=Vagococcus salmoninarum TaxID=2739 RepID=UPI00187F3D3C|nr:hypothetical protein [Vagococcus salmoninarum]MBE9390152.1 hypothetical protein [Vagococcus salmoninarum]
MNQLLINRYSNVCNRESDVVAKLAFLTKMMESFGFKYEKKYTYSVQVERGNIFKKTKVILVVVGSSKVLESIGEWIEEYLD